MGYWTSVIDVRNLLPGDVVAWITPVGNPSTDSGKSIVHRSAYLRPLLVYLLMSWICLPTYLPTYLPSYLPTYLPTYLPIYLPTYLPTYQHTYRTYHDRSDRRLLVHKPGHAQ